MQRNAKMTTSKFSIELPGSQESLFDYLGDPRHRMDWQSSLIWLRLDDEEAEPAAGVGWTEKAQGFGEFKMQISEYIRPTRWAESGHSKKHSMSLALDFEPGKKPGHTRVSVTVNLNLSGILKSVGWASKALLQPLMSLDLKKAAQLAKKQ